MAPNVLTSDFPLFFSLHSLTERTRTPVHRLDRIVFRIFPCRCKASHWQSLSYIIHPSASFDSLFPDNARTNSDSYTSQLYFFSIPSRRIAPPRSLGVFID